MGSDFGDSVTSDTGPDGKKKNGVDTGSIAARMRPRVRWPPRTPERNPTANPPYGAAGPFSAPSARLASFSSFQEWLRQGSQYYSKFRGILDISVLSAGSDIYFTGRN